MTQGLVSSTWERLLSEKCESISHLVVSDSLWPHGLYPARLLCPWNSPGKNTRVSSHSLLHGIGAFRKMWNWSSGCPHSQGCREFGEGGGAGGGVTFPTQSVQCYLQAPANPNKKDVLRLPLVDCRDGLTHTCHSPLWSQNSYGAIPPWKWVKAVTLPPPQARRECGKNPRELAPLQQFKFQLRCLLTKQTWLFHHSNVSGTSNSFSHSFSSLFFPPHSLPFAWNPSSPPCCTICLEKNFFFGAASCQVWHQLILI